MTIFHLVAYVGVAALLLTFLVGYFKQGHKNWLLTFLQNFCGALFVFSGAVKAIDPLGTAYKMEQYFAEFQYTFKDSAMSFLAPIFPMLSEHSTFFSIFMIVLEIVIGVMLLIGAKNRLNSWLFFLIIIFFLILTGFTFLTGYVPMGENFFNFAAWGDYKETNMRVTDCGCFGDFLKLKPRISFFKDVVLLVPAILFLFKHKDMHQLFSARTRNWITLATLVGTTIFCIRNVAWDEPIIDFRPFAEGVNIRERKAAEAEAEAAVPVSYVLTNKETKQTVKLSMNDYLAKYQEYPKEAWDIDQERGEPSIPHTKISEFSVQDLDGNDIGDDLISDENYSFMIVAHKLYNSEEHSKTTYQDTTFVRDTIPSGDSIIVETKIAGIETRERDALRYVWDEYYQTPYLKKVNTIAEEAEKAGYKIYCVTAFAEPAMIDDFRHQTQAAYPFYTADNILLKTIIRSNPGVLLLKNGLIVKKWHHRKLPTFEEIKAQYMK